VLSVHLITAQLAGCSSAARISVHTLKLFMCSSAERHSEWFGSSYEA
jgi:hypothetical protein